MCFFASIGAASLMALNATAQTPAPTPAAAESAPATLPYGVEDVLKLSRAQVSEDVILNYVHNSGTIYSLGPNDVVYLRNEGVSDRVINTMLDQRQNVPAQAAAQIAAVASQEQVSPDPNVAAAAQAAAQYGPTYVQAAQVYAPAEPTCAPASTVYVIPYNSTRFNYANSYPYYYGSNYRYGGPSVVVGVGYGRGYGYRGSYGGHHGGYRGGGHNGHHGHR